MANELPNNAVDPEAVGYGGSKPIVARAKDGTIHRFPAGTADGIVDKVMADYAEKQKDKSTTWGELVTGMMDPVEGGGELVSDLLPNFVNRELIKANNKVADYSMGLIRKLPEGGKPEQMKQREAAIQANRGANTGTDYARMGGDILSPINWLGVGLGKLATPTEYAVKAAGPVMGRIVSAITQGGIAGGVSGAVQPTTGEDRTTEKGIQITEGMGAGAVLGGIFSTAGAATHKVGEWLARQYPDSLLDKSVHAILRAIKQDEKSGGPSAADAIKLVKEAGKAREANRKPMTLADVGGENVKGLAGQVGRPPGAARGFIRSFLEKRDEAAAKRIEKDISRFISGGPSVFEATDMLVSARRAASTPAYEKAFDLQGVWSPRLQQFIDDPRFTGWVQQGYRAEADLALAEGRPIKASQLGVDIDSNGNIDMVTGKPNMRVLDMAKRGLDGAISDQRDPVTGRLSELGVRLNKIRGAYIDELERLDTTGKYKAAREAWAGPSASLDALKMGRTVLDPSHSPEEIQAEIAKLSPANREFYLMGVADMLKERIAKTGLNSDESKQIIKSAWMRKQLRPLFKNYDAYSNFVDSITKERQMFTTGSKLLGGSQSIEKYAQDQQDIQGLLDTPELSVIKKLAKGKIMDAAATTLKMLFDLDQKPNEELNEKIAKILFTTKIPSEVEKMILSGAKQPKNRLQIPSEVLQQAGPGMTPAATVDITKERSPQGPEINPGPTSSGFTSVLEP